MAIINKIVDTLYENSEAYYTFPEIVSICKSKPLPIHIEQNRGTKMRWNQDIPAPFDYGDIPNYLNHADNMGWDVIIAPSSQATDKNLLLTGVVRISDEAESIPIPHGNVKGNHKLILAKDGLLTDKDKSDITEYFHGNKAFMKPDFFDKSPSKKVIEEDWEKSTLRKMKLGDFKNTEYGGIAVGPTARNTNDAQKFSNKLPITNPNSTKK